jgi:hypothetical protein
MVQRIIHWYGVCATIVCVIGISVAANKVLSQQPGQLSDAQMAQRLEMQERQLEQRRETAIATLRQDYDRLKADQQGIKSLQRAFRTARVLLNQANQNSPKKWRCNAYGSLHDDPSECSDPSQGGVWITQPSPAAEQAQDDVNRLKRDLDDKQKDYKALKNNYIPRLNQEKAQLTAGIETLKNQIRNIPTTKNMVDQIAKAANDNSTDCNKSASAIADVFGLKGPDGKNPLAGKDANAQIQYMISAWKEITPEQAQDLSNLGKPAFAGRMGSGQPGDVHGHIALVVPGWLDDKYQQPLLAGGALDTDNPGTPGTAFSTGGKAINQVWRASRINEVKYYAPAD